MKTPWKSDKKPRYLRQEKAAAKLPGARAQINSGRLWTSLRDVVQSTVVGYLLIDCKTGKDGPLKSYTIKENDWEALHRDANRTPPGCHPALKLEIGKRTLLVIEEETWEEVGSVHLTNVHVGSTGA